MRPFAFALALAGALSVATWGPSAQATEPPVAAPAPTWAGMALRDDDGGVRIERVYRGAPAAASGLRAGDRVRSVDGTQVSSAAQVIGALRGRPSGTRARLGVQRAGAALAFEVALAPMPSPEGILRDQWLGQTLPSLPLRAAAGSLPPRLDELRGRVVVLAFGATWCPACRASEPLLDAWHKRLGAQGLVVVGVQHEAAERVAEAATARATKHPVSADPDDGIGDTVGISSIPTLLVLGRDGRVRDVAIGFDEGRWREVEALLQKLLAEPAGAATPRP